MSKLDFDEYRKGRDGLSVILERSEGRDGASHRVPVEVEGKVGGQGESFLGFDDNGGLGKEVSMDKINRISVNESRDRILGSRQIFGLGAQEENQLSSPTNYPNLPHSNSTSHVLKNKFPANSNYKNDNPNPPNATNNYINDNQFCQTQTSQSQNQYYDDFSEFPGYKNRIKNMKENLRYLFPEKKLGEGRQQWPGMASRSATTRNLSCLSKKIRKYPKTSL